LTFFDSDQLKDQKKPAKMTDKQSKGQISGLAITSGLNASKFLFVMARSDVTLAASMEVLRLLRERKINVKTAQQLLNQHRDTRVKRKFITENNLCFSNFLRFINYIQL
jgi:hypothetical protein